MSGSMGQEAGKSADKHYRPQAIFTDHPLAVILVLSVILRIAAALLLGNHVIDLPGTNDQISYHNLALRVLSGYGFTFGQDWWPITKAGAPTAHWSFLYTLYLVGVYFIFGQNPLVARLVQAILVGLLHPYLAYRIGRYVFSETIGLVAAGLTAVYAYFIYYDATLMTEPFYITSVMGALYLAILIAQTSMNKTDHVHLRKVIRLSICLGLALGAAVLLRQLFLLFVPFLFLWIMWVKRKQNWRLAVIGIFISSAIIVLILLPFTLYNFSRFGRFVLLNTNSGYAFFWANHPIYGTHFVPILTPEMGSYQSLIPAELWNLDEAALDQALLKRGLQFVIDDPIRYVLLSISRIPVYFMFWPSSDSGLISNISRVTSFGILLPFIIYGIILSTVYRLLPIKTRMSSPSFLLILFIVIYTGIHLLSWALIRYRLPVDAITLIYAGYGLDNLFCRFSPRTKIRIIKGAKG